MPAWLRLTIAGLLVTLGVIGLGWALFGELTSPASADTPVAVQVTLVIMAFRPSRHFRRQLPFGM